MRMRWYKPLYMGELAAKKRFSLIQGLRKKKPCIGAYVITPASGGNNILDIYPAPMLLLPPYRDEDMEILGIAVTYWEALEVVRQMVEDMYRCCGERLNLQEFMHCSADGDENRNSWE